MDDRIYDQPSKVAAEDGVVAVDGPDSVDVHFTPGAAEETGHRLLDGAAEAQGQAAVKRLAASSRPDGID